MPHLPRSHPATDKMRQIEEANKFCSEQLVARALAREAWTGPPTDSSRQVATLNAPQRLARDLARRSSKGLPVLWRARCRVLNTESVQVITVGQTLLKSGVGTAPVPLEGIGLQTPRSTLSVRSRNTGAEDKSNHKGFHKCACVMRRSGRQNRWAPRSLSSMDSQEQ